MGLAASQARLLSITARKSDCEFQSMRLSHEKIALARDMEHISDEYQDALGKTKLVYDYYGSGMQPQDVSYNLLMRPSVYNDYYPKLITDKSNRVVLDSKYAAAAIAAGIPVEGLSGTPSDAVRNKFIQALAEQNIITLQTAASVQHVTYGNTIGLGSTFSITAGTKEVTWTEFLDMLDAYGCSTSAYGITFGDGVVTSMGGDAGSGKQGGCELVYSYDPEKKESNFIAGNPSFTLRQLLEDDKHYLLSFQSAWAEFTPIYETAFLQRQIVGGEADSSVLNWMLEQFSTLLGGVVENDKGLQYAYDAVYNLLYANNDIQDAEADLTSRGFPDKNATDRKRWVNYDAKPTGSSKTYLDIMNEVSGWGENKLGEGYDTSVISKGYDSVGFAFNYGKNGSGAYHKKTSEVSIDLTNVAKVFLTAYAEYIQGVGYTDYDYSKGRVSQGKKFYEPKDNDKFVIADTSELNTGDQDLMAGFYDAMFNIICTHGWVKNEQINDSAYLQEQMKNGTVFISTISNDGFFYQGNYNTDNYIVEVPDQEAIAQAEAKYNSEKAKIQSKEDTLDVKMKNLDTEISSLTTEYDTTKNIINKAVEKSFKRYDA
jgi:hypothetical protein